MLDNHNISGFPGGFCLTCFSPIPLDEVMDCQDCTFGGEYGYDIETLCDLHVALAAAIDTCPPDAEKVAAYNALYEAKFGKETP